MSKREILVGDGKEKIKQSNKGNTMIERNFDNYFDQIKQAAAKKTGSSFSIENEFVPTMVNGECEVVLRLLPQPKTEAAPFIENRTHSFKGTDGKWHVVDCLRKAGHKCPICDWNSAVFKAFPKEQAKKISKKKAKRQFISNVYVVKNPAAPDTEGKAYRFKFGIQIMEKLLTKMSDQNDPDKGLIKGINVFDYYKGANLIYKAKDGAYGPNPENSYFGDQKPISDKNNNPLSEEEIQAIDDALYELKPCEKDTSAVTFAEVLDLYEKFTEEKLYRRGVDADGKATYEPIIPGLDSNNTAALNESVQSEAEPFTEKPSSEGIDDFLDSLK